MRYDDTESEGVYFRSSSRLFRLNGDWFFASREGDLGPFRTEQEAEVELSRHVEAGKLRGAINPKLRPKEKFEIVSDQPAESAYKQTGKMLRLAGFDKTSLTVFRERASSRG